MSITAAFPNTQNQFLQSRVFEPEMGVLLFRVPSLISQTKVLHTQTPEVGIIPHQTSLPGVGIEVGCPEFQVLTFYPEREMGEQRCVEGGCEGADENVAVGGVAEGQVGGCVEDSCAFGVDGVAGAEEGGVEVGAEVGAWPGDFDGWGRGGKGVGVD